MTPPTTYPLVLVTVGSDHHPFDRLLGWVGRWMAAGGAERVRCVAQTGPAAPVPLVDCRRYLPYDELQELIRRAAVVVSSGGPATLTEARLAGHVPVAVPRLARLGEVVDDHQWPFTRRLAAAGMVRLVEREEQLAAALDLALAGPAPVPAGTPVLPTESVRRVGSLLDELLAGRWRSRRGFGRVPEAPRVG